MMTSELQALETQLTGERARLTALTDQLAERVMASEEISSDENAAHTALEAHVSELAAELEELRWRAAMA